MTLAKNSFNPIPPLISPKTGISAKYNLLDTIGVSILHQINLDVHAFISSIGFLKAS
jgi:hypothetical protein